MKTLSLRALCLMIGFGTPWVPAGNSGQQFEGPKNLPWPQSSCELEFSLDPEILYSKRPQNTSASRDFIGIPSFFGIWDTEEIGMIKKTQGRASFLSRSLDLIKDSSGGEFNVNSVRVRAIENWKSGRLNLVSQKIDSIIRVNGELCLSVHSVGSLSEIEGIVSLWGRSQIQQQQASIQSLSRISGMVFVNDFEVQEFKPLGGRAHFHRSTIIKLGEGAGDLVLEDSKIQDLGNFYGRIFLRGNSSIERVPASFRGKIISASHHERP